MTARTPAPAALSTTPPDVSGWPLGHRAMRTEFGRLAELLPDARVVTVPGLTYSMVDEPDQLAAAVEAFASPGSAPRGMRPEVGNLAAS